MAGIVIGYVAALVGVWVGAHVTGDLLRESREADRE